MSNSQEKKPEEEPLKGEQIKHNELQNKGFIEKLRYIKSSITVEPILAGLIIPSMLSRLAIQNLNLDKACRVKRNFGDEICDALIERRGNTSYEAEVQAIISGIESWKSIIQTAIPTLLVIFMGAWSDRTGNRKICILMPILGEFMVCLSNILSTYFFYDISVEVTMVLEAVFPAVTGGWVMVFLGVFSYISDITDEESRTFRVGLVNLCMTAGIPLGTAFSGILLELWGYYGVFALSGSIYMITFLYGFIYLKSNTKPNWKENVSRFIIQFKFKRSLKIKVPRFSNYYSYLLLIHIYPVLLILAANYLLFILKITQFDKHFVVVSMKILIYFFADESLITGGLSVFSLHCVMYSMI